VEPRSTPPQSERSDTYLPHAEVERLHGARLDPKVVMIVLPGGQMLGREKGDVQWLLYREGSPRL
jgi:hypothetical protein